MIRLQLLALAGLTLGLLGACSYRLEGPPRLADSIVIVVIGNDGSLATGQTELVSQLADGLHRRLGWPVNPQGRARLELRLAEDEIDTTASGRLGIPSRWRITLRGTWTLTVPDYPVLKGRFTGDGFASNRDQEARGLATAAEQAADVIIADIESRARSWR